MHRKVKSLNDYYTMVIPPTENEAFDPCQHLTVSAEIVYTEKNLHILLNKTFCNALTI